MQTFMLKRSETLRKAFRFGGNHSQFSILNSQLKILFCILMFIGVQTYAEDTLSPAARNDSAIAAFRFEAMKQALGEGYQPQPIATESYKPPDLGNIAIRMTVGLGVILVLLYVLYVLAKKVRKIESPSSNDKQSVIQLLDSKFLGAGKTIFLIKAGAERILVVGSSQESMRTLSEIQGAEARYILETYDSKPVTAAQFSATVDHLLRRFRREGGS